MTSLPECVRPSNSDEALALIEAGLRFIDALYPATDDFMAATSVTLWRSMSNPFTVGVPGLKDRVHRGATLSDTYGNAVTAFTAQCENAPLTAQLEAEVAAFRAERAEALGLPTP
jgi:hypothetical protein